MLPRHNAAKTNLEHGFEGNQERLFIQKDSFDKVAFLSKTVELSDIDNAVMDFVKNNIVLYGENGPFPVFTIFSNERFSEYSQTWEHTDKEGNLLMDFLTVRRDTVVKMGTNQGGNYNIPNNRKYTVCMRTILEDNGTEAMEVYSMEMPVPVDIKYHVGIITSKNEHINAFNTVCVRLFQHLQYYIKPNGFYMPLKLSSITDNTESTIDGRKFFSQMAEIELKGYLVPKESLHVDIMPIRKYFGNGLEKAVDKPYVNYEVYGDGEFKISAVLYANNTVCEFRSEDCMSVDAINTTNVRSVHVFIDKEKVVMPDGGRLFIPAGSMVRVKVVKIESNSRSEVEFSGTIVGKIDNV